ncbi:MAG: protein kinase [Polyangiaceae bacterium]
MHVRGQILGERYRLERRVGAGATSSVWAATDLASSDLVALKLLSAGSDSNQRRRLEQEAVAIQRVRHPYVRRVRELAEFDRDVALVMDLLDGEPLSAVLARDAPLPVSSVARLIGPAVSAMGTAHAQGVVHRDLKPENLLVLADGRAAVLDFGIAKLVDDRALRLTRTGGSVGTPQYMAPEQLLAEREIDHRVDVWAMGLVLAELLTGVLPTRADSIDALLRKVLFDPMPPVGELNPALPRAVCEVCDAMLARDKRHRLPDLRPVLATLAAFDESLSALAFEAPRERSTVGEARVGATVDTTLTTSPTISAREVRRAVFVLITMDPSAVANDGGQLVLATCRRYGATSLAVDGVVAVAVEAGSLERRVIRARACGEELVRAGWAHHVAVMVADGVFRGGALEDEVLESMRSRGLPLAESGVGLIGFDDEARALLARAESAEESRAQAPFVGRQREVSMVLALAHELREDVLAHAPTPRAALFTGQPGMGKSRLCDELATQLAEQGFRVVLVRGSAAEASSAFSLFSHAPWAELDPRIERAVRDALASTHVAPSMPGEPLLADRLLYALLHELRSACAITGSTDASGDDADTEVSGSSPILALLVDDLDSADAASLGVLERLWAAAVDLPLLLVGFCDPSFPAAHSNLTTRLQASCHPLLPLSRPHAARLLDWHLAQRGEGARDAATTRALLDRAECNPMFLEQLAHANSRDELPTSIEVAVQRRIATLASDTRRGLRACALLGGPFAASWLRPLLAEPTTSQLEALVADLDSRGLLRAVRGDRRGPDVPGDEPILYGFRNEIVREVAYRSLPEEERTRGHWVVAELLASASFDPAVIARHFERGGDRARGCEYRVEAARRALASDDCVGAYEHATNALAGASTETAAAEARVLMAHAARLLGRFEEGAALAEQAAADLPAHERHLGWLELGACAERLEDYATLRRACEAMAAPISQLVATEPFSPAQVWEQADVSAQLSAMASLAGLGESSLELLTRAEASLGPDAPVEITARVLAARAWRVEREGNYEESYRLSQRAVELLSGSADRRSFARALTNLGCVALELGLNAESLEHFARAEHLAEQIGISFFVDLARHNRGFAMLRAGRAREARETLEAPLSRAPGAPHFEVQYRVYRAQALLAEGLSEEALAETERASALRKPGLFESYARATAALAALENGLVERAVEEALEARQRLSSHAQEGECFVHDVVATTLVAAADARAREAIEAGLALVEDRLAAISEPRHLESYRAIPSVRRILERAGELGIASDRRRTTAA